MKFLRALVFDVDGTLANTEEAHRESFNEAFRLHGLDWHWSRDLYKELLRTTGGKERMAAYLSTLAITDAERARLIADIPHLHRAKTAIYSRRMAAGEVVLRDGVERLMDEAQAANVRLAIATTTSFGNIAALLAATLGPTALDRFAAIGAGDEVEHKKPAPDVYLAVLRKLDIPASHCVAIEDSVNGLRSATAAALFTVVTPTYWTEHEDFSEADLVLPSLGSREAPLPDPVAADVGGPWLGIAELDQKLAARHQARRS